jgi:protein-S-isoprenylcysteine O-methyltransferase Ste14
MMVRIGNFLFQYRNGLFPLVYALLLFRSQPLMDDYRIAAILGAVVACGGQLLRAATIGLQYIIRGGRNRKIYAENLVQGGIFAHCRNPLYLGNFAILAGVGLASNSVLFVSAALPFFLFAYAAIILAEENFLRHKFGWDFEEYCARVPRLVPNLRGLGWTLRGMNFNWRRLITAEYGTTYIWLVAVIGVTLKNAWFRGDLERVPLLERCLWSALVLVNLGYALARFAKKTGLLRMSAQLQEADSTRHGDVSTCTSYQES